MTEDRAPRPALHLSVREDIARRMNDAAFTRPHLDQRAGRAGRERLLDAADVDR